MLCLISQNSIAQKSLNSSSTLIQSNFGSVSVSIGEVFYMNKGSAYSISEGIQHGIVINKILTNSNIHVLVYPNPTNSNFNIDIPESFVGGELSIIDLTGKIVIKERVTQSLTKRIDISNLNDGIYLIRMNNGSAHFTDRLIKK